MMKMKVDQEQVEIISINPILKSSNNGNFYNFICDDNIEGEGKYQKRYNNIKRK